MKDDDRIVHTDGCKNPSDLHNKNNVDLIEEIDAYIKYQIDDGSGIDQSYIEDRLSILQKRDPFELDFDPENEIQDLPLNSVSTFKKEHKPRNWRRVWRIAEIAALIVLMFAIIAGAGGFNLFEFISNLQTETITFNEQSPEPTVTASDDTDISPDYSSLQEALDAHGITVKLCPTWIPEDYILQSVDVFSMSDSTRFSCDYVSDRGQLYIQITVSTSETTIRTEEVEPEGTHYEKGGIDFYITSNTSNIKCNWVNSGYDCKISGVMTFDEMTKMIDSIK